jgi:hypothetical protein
MVTQSSLATLGVDIDPEAVNAASRISGLPNMIQGDISRGGNIRGAWKNTEVINTDHRFFFTPYTIAKIAVDAGYEPYGSLALSRRSSPR